MAFHVEYKESGEFVLAPQGQFQAVACELLNHGTSNKVYKNQQTGADENRIVHEVQFVFQLNKLDDASGKRFEVRSKKLNALSLHEKSGLRAFLLSWRGHDLLPAELKPPGIDLEQLIGKNALISVVHTKSGEKTYANIGSIMPLVEGMPPIAPLDYESKQAKLDAQKAQAASQEASQAPPPQQVAAANPSDIPF